MKHLNTLSILTIMALLTSCGSELSKSVAKKAVPLSGYALGEASALEDFPSQSITRAIITTSAGVTSLNLVDSNSSPVLIPKSYLIASASAVRVDKLTIVSIPVANTTSLSVTLLIDENNNSKVYDLESFGFSSLDLHSVELNSLGQIVASASNSSLEIVSVNVQRVNSGLQVSRLN